ncbi:MAG: DUF1344 domain-containing protein [Candidatus Rokuibacteriota bacterium]
MTRGFLVLISLVLLASVAGAAEIEGKVKSWDAATNMITLEDGTELSVPADAQVPRDQMKEGASVKVTYEEKDGKKVVNKVEVNP